MAGEIVNEKMLKKSIVAMGIGNDYLDDATAAIVSSIKTENNVASAFTSIENYVGMILHRNSVNE